MMQVESRTQKALYNIIIGFICQFLILFLNFASRTVFVKLFGADYLGINGLYTNILVVLSLAELGIGNVMTYSLYKPVYDKDWEMICSYLSFFKKCYIVIAAIIAIAGFSCIPFLKFVVKSSLDIWSISIYYIIFLLDSISSYFLIYKSTLLIADQKNYIITSYKTWGTILLHILQIIMMLLTKNYVLYLTLQIFNTLFCNIMISRKTSKIYPWINNSKNSPSLNPKEKRIILNKIKSQGLFKLGCSVLNGTDNILISVIIGTIYVGFYSNYCIFISAINTLLSVLIQNIITSIGNLNAEGDKNRVYEWFNLLVYIFHIISAVISICLFLLLNDIVFIWLGSEYLLKISDVACIALNFYIQNIINPVWMYREAMGLFEKVKYLVLITAGLNIIFSVIGGVYFGIGGIILATGLARLCTTVWYEPMLLFRYKFDRKVAEYIKRQGIFVCITGISFVTTFVIASQFQSITILHIIIKGIIGITVTLICFGIFTYKMNERTQLWNFGLTVKIKIFNTIHGPAK